MHDFERKLDRARKHLAVIDQSFGDFLRDKAHTVDVKFDAKERQYTVSIRSKRVVPHSEWSLVLGDLVHNLRSALDALTYQLSVKHSGSLTEQQAIQVQFPIFDTQYGFKKRAKVSFLHPDVIAEMERLQPYNAQNFAANSLRVLSQLNNIDKHRHIVTTHVLTHGVSTFFLHPNGTKVHRSDGYVGPFVDGAEVGKWPAIGGGVDPCLCTDPDLSIDIAFGDGMPLAFKSVRRQIAEVIADLETFVFGKLKEFLK